jgi:SAM-dependent methyltransferase
VRRNRRSREFYDAVHYSPGAVRGSIPGKLAVSDPWYQLVLELLERHGVAGGGRVLEVGCGLGGFCQRLSSRGGRVTGADFSVSALSAARRHAQEAKEEPSVRFVAADATRLPFKNESFDLIVCAETLEHTFEVAACLRELFRVCTLRGFVVVTVPNATMAVPFGLIVHAVGADQPQVLVTYFRLRKLVEDVGFVVVEENGTNFFRDMILNDALPPPWRNRTIRIGRILDRWVPRGAHLWKLTAGTVGILAQVPSGE